MTSSTFKLGSRVMFRDNGSYWMGMRGIVVPAPPRSLNDALVYVQAANNGRDYEAGKIYGCYPINIRRCDDLLDI